MQHSRIKNRSVRYVCRGLFSYYIQARSPINGQNRPPEQTKPTKPEEHPPPAKTETDSRHRPHSDTGNFRLPAAPRDEIRHLRNPPDASPADPKAPSAPSSCEPDHNPCMGSRPPYGRPAKRFLKILSKNDKYFLIFKICSYICRRNDPKTKHQRLWIYSQ